MAGFIPALLKAIVGSGGSKAGALAKQAASVGQLLDENIPIDQIAAPFEETNGVDRFFKGLVGVPTNRQKNEDFFNQAAAFRQPFALNSQEAGIDKVKDFRGEAINNRAAKRDAGIAEQSDIRNAGIVKDQSLFDKTLNFFGELGVDPVTVAEAGPDNQFIRKAMKTALGQMDQIDKLRKEADEERAANALKREEDRKTSAARVGKILAEADAATLGNMVQQQGFEFLLNSPELTAKQAGEGNLPLSVPGAAQIFTSVYGTDQRNARDLQNIALQLADRRANDAVRAAELANLNARTQGQDIANRGAQLEYEVTAKALADFINSGGANATTPPQSSGAFTPAGPNQFQPLGVEELQPLMQLAPEDRAEAFRLILKNITAKGEG